MLARAGGFVGAWGAACAHEVVALRRRLGRGLEKSEPAPQPTSRSLAQPRGPRQSSWFLFSELTSLEKCFSIFSNYWKSAFSIFSNHCPIGKVLFPYFQHVRGANILSGNHTRECEPAAHS